MKLTHAVIFFAFIFGFGFTAATAQTQTDNNNAGRIPAPVVVGPFQALGNVIRNPDADPPRRRVRPVTQPSPPPTVIPPGALNNGALADPGSR
jgi:hypothetical protein